MHTALILALTALLFTPCFAFQQTFAQTDLTIPQIQGSAASSPYAGQQLTQPLRGCVTGIAAEGFFLQDPTGDGDPATSDGIYVYRYSSWKNPRGLKPGDLIELTTYKVMEFYGQTELSGLPNDKNATYRVLGKCALPAPAPILPLTDPRVDPARQFERNESMRVVVDLDASVVGPTNRYESRYPAGDPELTLASAGSPFYDRRVFARELPVGRGTLALSGGLGVDLPQVNVFDRVAASGLTGVLAYQFGRYVLLVDNPTALRVQPAELALPTIEATGTDEWKICTFNAENLFDAVDDGDGDIGDWTPADDKVYRAGLARRAALIRDRLGGCTILAAQEIEGKDAVWADLARELGPNYRFDYRESADARDITVGLLYDATRVELRQSTSVPACSLVDYGVSNENAQGPRVDAAVCPNGSYPLYDRAPYVADVVVANASQDRRLDVRLVVVHLKSKRGDEVENAARRVQQARHVAGLLNAEMAAGRLALALGDFNDDLGSEPLAEFRDGVNLYERHTPLEDRYSYIYSGRAQAVDHMIMTPQLDAYYVSGGPVHLNADYAEPLPGVEGRASDHDPMLVRFRFEPTGVSVALLGAASGAAGAVYHQPLRLK